MEILYDATDGANWDDNSGWLVTGSDECDWFGVTCTGGIVTELDLHENNLDGTIPTEITDLSQLGKLDVWQTFFSCSLFVGIDTLFLSNDEYL